MKLTKVQKLAIAAAVAPELRTLTGGRKINVVDKDGHVTRQIDPVEMRKKILERSGIEFGMVPTVAPKDAREQIICAGPGPIEWWHAQTDPAAACPNRAVPTKEQKSIYACRGRFWRCRPCATVRRYGPPSSQSVCAGWGDPCPTAAVPPKSALRQCAVDDRNGEPWRCPRCATRRAYATMTPERRELRREVSRKCAEKAQKVANLRSPKERREAASKAWAARTPEQRSEIGRRSNATRRARKAKS